MRGQFDSSASQAHRWTTTAARAPRTEWIWGPARSSGCTFALLARKVALPVISKPERPVGQTPAHLTWDGSPVKSASSETPNASSRHNNDVGCTSGNRPCCCNMHIHPSCESWMHACRSAKAWYRKLDVFCHASKIL
eukprot:358274-Chlamydomonas_euryale.AAC.5